MKKSVAIIGSGPAALMLAAHIDTTLFDVTVYERNFAVARKFLVAGDGGFNLTHSEDIELIVRRYTPHAFLANCLQAFTNTDLRAWLKQLGVETYVGSSKRIFPVEGIKPIDVLNAILNEVKKNNVVIKTQHSFKGWTANNELIIEHNNIEHHIKADSVVYALGGASWSKTGSDGAWMSLFANKGIDTKTFQASNCAYEIKWDASFLEKAEGQALKNIALRCHNKEKKGEVVITKYGIEGGAVYALSPEIRKQLNEDKHAIVFLDLKPTLTLEELKYKLSAKGMRSQSAILKEQLNLSDVQLALLKHNLTKEEFTHTNTLAEKIKNLPLHIVGAGPIDDAISTVGGIALHEVDTNFQLHKMPQHYVIGEMLDWDAPTGGYLLQACFSMGYWVAKQLTGQPQIV